MSKTIYNQLSKDLLTLYCSVKHSSIEDAMVRVSKAQDNDFCLWLKLKEKIVKSSIKTPRVFGALQMLCDFRNKIPYGSNIDRGSVVKYLLNSTETQSYLSIIFSFDSILKESRHEILVPFSDLIDILTHDVFRKGNTTKEQEAVEKEATETVRKDLDVINNLYSLKEESKIYEKTPLVRQQRQDMFINLLNMFSEEIASAYGTNGMPEIGNKMRQRILARPPQYGIAEVMPLKPLSWDKINAAKSMSAYVWDHYNIKWTQYNHDNIETMFLNMVGAISNEEMRQIRGNYERQREPLNVETDYSGLNLGNKISSDKRMNPEYIHMLSVFFNYLQSKMKMV